MTKLGRLSPTHQQLCFAHGIQLAVLDVLYGNPNKPAYSPPEDTSEDQGVDVTECEDVSSSEDEDEDSDALDTQFSTELVTDNDDSEDVCLVPNEELRHLLEKVRAVIKIFRKSPKKNDKILLKNTLVDFGKEITLVVDSRTRWSSMFDMVHRFVMIKTSVLKSYRHENMNSEICFTEAEWNTLSSLASALEPVKLTVEALCRRETNLYTADAALEFMLNKLETQDTQLSAKLHSALELRIKQRRTELSGVLEFLHTCKYKNWNSPFAMLAISAMANIMKLLIIRFNNIDGTQETNDESLNEDDNIIEIFTKAGTSKKKPKTALQIELEEALEKAVASAHSEKSQPEKNLLTTIKQEIIVSVWRIKGIASTNNLREP